MKPDSTELAYRIDVMVAFQNGEPVQWRSDSLAKWIDSTSMGLAFHFDTMEYRLKPVLIEGWINPSKIHMPRQSGCNIAGCIFVRQLESDI